MLKVKIFVNENKIDEILIHNTASIDKAGRHIYNAYLRIDELDRTDNVTVTKKLDRQFHHERSRGWKPLVLQVLKHIINLEDL